MGKGAMGKMNKAKLPDPTGINPLTLSLTYKSFICNYLRLLQFSEIKGHTSLHDRGDCLILKRDT